MSEELKAALARIACLEGEIAKRDETIARLEPQLNRAIQANYDLREELAACRVAVENCEMFRARIVELESRYQRDVYGLNNEGDPIGGDPAGGYANDNARLRTELAALKAQEPVGSIEIQGTGFLCAPFPAPAWAGGRQPAVGTKLYAAPVSEAKAQGVVMPERKTKADYGVYIDEFADEAAAIYNAALDEVARLNAAPVHQVSVPDGYAIVPIVPTPEMIKAALDKPCFDPLGDPLPWSHITRTSYAAMLNAAQAAPAADAGLVDMYRHLQTVTPYRFKKIQDASVTDGGDVLYFHKDRFDAALLDDMAANCARESK